MCPCKNKLEGKQANELVFEKRIHFHTNESGIRLPNIYSFMFFPASVEACLAYNTT